MHGVRYRFEAFELDPVERTLSFDGVEVPLTGKPFELLLLLATSGGRTVRRQEAIAALWPATTVHQNSLAVVMSTLRQALARVCPATAVVETVPQRGYRLAVPVIQVLAGRAGDVPSPAHRDTAFELFGRARELERLRELFAGARSGRGALAWVTGEPGIGKTALLERTLLELTRIEPALSSGWGKCLELRQTPEPFYPIIEAVSQILRGPFRECMTEALITHCPHWCLHHPGRFAREVIAERLQREASPIEASVLMRQLCDAFSVLAARAPLVLLLEDLQWVDSATADLLRMLAARLPNERALLIGTFRAASATLTPPLLRGLVYPSDARLAQVLHLPRLHESDVLALVEREHPDANLHAELAHALWKKSEGLPLFAVRLLRAASGSRSAADVFSSSEASVTGFIRQQLVSLPPRHRSLLDLAAVIGEEFNGLTVALGLGVPENAVEDQLAALDTEHQLVSRLREEELHDGRVTTRFRFGHALVRAELYDELTPRRRLELHGRVADALSLPAMENQAHGRGDHAFHPLLQAEIAFHLERARRFAEAVLALLRAGDYCDRRFAKPQALIYYERARLLLPKTAAAEQAIFRVLLAQNRGWARFGLGELDDARSEFRRASDGVRELEANRDEPATRAALELGFAYLGVQWEDPLLRRPAPMLSESSVVPDLQALRAEAYFGECAALCRVERYLELLEVAGEFSSLARLSGSERRKAEALAWFGVAQLEMGDLVSAKATLDACLDLAHSIGHTRALDMSARARAVLHTLQGELDEAAAHYDAIRRRTVMSWGAALCLSELGDIRCKQGRVREAFAHHAEADALARGALGARAVPNTGWIHRELGATREALELDLRALECCPRGELQRRRLLSYGIAATRARLGDVQGARLALCDVHLPEGTQKSLLYLQHEWMARCEIDRALGQHESLARLASAWYSAARAHDAREGMMRALFFLAQSSIAADDLDDAREHVERALELYRTHSMPLIGLSLFRQWELVELRSGRRVAAERAREAADSILERVAASIDDLTLRRTFRQSSTAAPAGATVTASPSAAPLRA